MLSINLNHKNLGVKNAFFDVGKKRYIFLPTQIVLGHTIGYNRNKYIPNSS